MSRGDRRSTGLRPLLVVALATVGLLLAPTAAVAAVSVDKASLSSTGTLAVDGRGAVARATVTVTSAESTARGTADRDGRFRISATGYRASDCRARVSDGSTSVTVTLSGCTPSGSTPAPTTVVITPDVAELGPGYVGSDFTTFSSTTTTMTLGPDALGPVRWDLVSGALPAGLGLVDPNAGFTPAKSVHVAIAGTPTTVGVSTFTIRGTDANGLTATRTYTVRIHAARTLDLTPQGAAPTLAVGTAATWWFEGLGGVRPYRWAVSAGQVPPGMSLLQDNPDGPLARVGGTPTTPGTYTFTLRLTDAQAATVSRTFSLTVPQPDSSTAPAAPTLLAPADGASVTTPFTLDWTATFDPSLSSNGGYNWQVSTSSSFATLAARDSTLPSVTEDTVEGLAPGTYFWRVQAVDGQLRSSEFSAPRTVTVTSTSTPPATGTATLTVTAGGRSGERVTSTPAGVSVPVGSTGSATFPAGTAVTLAVSNSREAVWSGACSSGGAKTRTCAFTLTGSASVTANVQ